ncbi:MULTISPECIES: EH signature domain-containing protein [unclassified Microbulbifer]|uniref:EH signature domain-containing protein n=1 Tax=unclassified Microbulbifer TaxID=2619833 RepID=UPI0027E3BB16|nr:MULTISPECIES: EH signature domain-containing protein [unclassified Microbulbifer]
MRLPATPPLDFSWPAEFGSRWQRLASQAAEKAGSAGEGDFFQRVKQELLQKLAQRDFQGLAETLNSRSGARACTRLWLENESFRKALCRPKALELLAKAHQPRLSRLTLSNLCELYLVEYDHLPGDVRDVLSQIITRQCELIPAREDQDSGNIWQVARRYPWLFSDSGPRKLVESVIDTGRELEETLRRLGLAAYVGGRYGEVCRALYYLNVLRELPYGATDPVMDELLKASVHDAPYQGDELIGHAVLQIIIDRVDSEVPEPWRNFVLNIAGDPRVASASASYRKWWQALGATRTEKVRGWLSKLDLRLFLQAVEQFGIQMGKDDLQRMYPARKRFLEGLLNEKLIRNTRLMLGWQAERVIKSILGEDSGVSYALLEGGGLNDKAIIYIDCGHFFLLEGSHNFKLWIYLAKPDELLTNYNKTSFNHSDLTRVVPGKYQREYPGLPHVGIQHSGTWQRRVFEFLGDNGIGLDIEKFMLPGEYSDYIQSYGIPFVDSGGGRNRRRS